MELKNQLESWSDGFLDVVPNIITASIVLIIAIVIGKIIRRSVRKVVARAKGTKAMVQLMGTLSYIATIAVGMIVALNVLELGGAATSLLAGAGVVGIAIGFAFQDIAANFIAGIFIAFQKPMRVGDLVETNDYYGTVRKISLRMTEVETLQGQRVFIPNKDIILNPLVEYNALKNRRIDLQVGISYNEDLEKTKKLVLKTIENLEITNNEKPVDFYYEDFGDSSINFVVRFWSEFNREPDYLEARSQAIIAIKKAFDKEGITIPFPIRTLYGSVAVKE
jgi:small conductance mechanosensitive channel